ncbi:MAG: transposase family protein, partial [Moorea sp. SIO2I5]|nr:transposase family protein [Moorena sp. SIO2I5]
MSQSRCPMVIGFDKPTNSTYTSSPSLQLQPALDVQQVQQQMLEHFEHLSDPRGKQGVLHPFVSIVMIALLA